MNILVTGSSSYVGKYIILGLLSLNHKVVGTSRTDPKIKNENFIWLSHDLSKSPLKKFKNKIDVIVHLAGLAWYDRPVIDYVNSNINTTMNLEKMIKNIKPIVTFYTSSRNIYGEIEVSQIKENTSIINPIVYAHTKYIAEQILLESSSTIIFRLPSIIGVGTHGWIDSIYKKLIKNEDIEFINTKFNNFIHASELPIIIDKFIKKSIFKTDLYLLGCSNIIYSKTLISRMKHLLNSKSLLIENKSKKNSYTISVKKIKKIYKTMSVEDSIDKYIKEMQNLN